MSTTAMVGTATAANLGSAAVADLGNVAAADLGSAAAADLGTAAAADLGTASAVDLGTVAAADLGTAAAAPLRPLHVDNVVMVARAKPPLSERLSPASASESAFCFFGFHLVGMVTRINAEILMLTQKRKNGGMVM